MGEEEKKSEESKIPAVEEKKQEAPKTEENKKEEKKSEETKAEEPPPPPPPPQEIILKVYMHCEGCARKVRRCLKGFQGVEDVITDCRTSKVVVKGEKADPIRVLERIQKKSHRQVELISPIPKPPAEQPKKPEEKKEVVKIEEKKEELPVIIVVLGVYMHCEACAQEIKKRILRMKGAENAEPDLKSSQVIVKGIFEPEKLVDHVHKRTGKHAVIVKVDKEKKEEEKPKEKDQAKKVEEGEKEAKKGVEEGKENKEGGDIASTENPPAVKPEASDIEGSKMDLKKIEFFHNYPQNYQVYPSKYAQDLYAYPPQLFSDENPNACSIM